MDHPAEPSATSLVGVMRGIGDEITDADDAFLAIVGYARSDFDALRLNWRHMTPPEYLHLDDAGIRQAAETGGFTVPYQKEFIRKDGSRVPVLLVCAFVPDAPGAWMGYVVDLSSSAGMRAPAEVARTSLEAPVPLDFYQRLVHELVRERARMAAMLESTDALVWAVDPQLHLLTANAAYQRAQRLLTGRVMEVGDHVMGEEFPEATRRRWLDAYARALGGERVSVAGAVVADAQTRHYEGVLTPMLDAAGQVIGVSVVAHDVTARATAERALRASEARFRTLTARSPMGVFLADASGACVYANPRFAELCRVDAGDLAGRGWIARVHPDDAALVSARWGWAVREGEPLEADFRLVVGDGEVRHVRLRMAPVEEEDGLTGFVGTVDDETDRRTLAARTRQREKMESLGTLAGGIAHDFNNILGAVLGFADLALEDTAGNPALHEMLREIRTASLRARDLVRQILAFSRRTEQEHAPVELRALVAECARLLRAVLPANVRLEVRATVDDAWVVGDATGLQQVLLNLAMNAEHAMRATGGGRLTIGLSPADGGRRIALTVADTGAGMPPAVRERIFEPFFTTKPVGEGTGMGLAVVHGIVAAHQGTVTVESAPGCGTCFEVRLPRAAAPDATSAAAESLPRGHGHVLLVEDEPALARFAERALVRAGFEVTVCRDGGEALRVAADPARALQVVVSDVTMPGLTGDRLARELRASRPSLPVLLMSGYSALAGDDDARAAGATGLLRKPFSATELVTAVLSALGSPVTSR